MNPRCAKNKYYHARSTIILAGLLSFGLAGCAVDADEPGTSDGEADDVLIVGMDSDPGVLDAHIGTGWITWRVGSTLFETLVAEDLTQSGDEQPIPDIVPGLAEDWETSDDGLEYTFYLRQNVLFHDGTEFDADAVEYNIRRMWDEESPQYSAAAGASVFHWQYLEDVEVIDSHTVTLTLTQPYEPLLRLIAGGSRVTGMMSPTAIEEYGEDIAEYPVGTGPFQFEERVQGDRIEVSRNPEYWGDQPGLDGIVFRPIPDTAARAAAIRSGEVDMIWEPSPDSIDGLLNEGFQIADGITPHIWYVQFDMNDEYLSIPEVRQAINLAIDRESITEDLLQGTAVPASDFQAQSLPSFESREEYINYDPERAQELLAEVGLEDGFETSFFTHGDASGGMQAAQVAEQIQADLAHINIEASLEVMELQSFFAYRSAEGMGDYGLSAMAWGMGTPFWIYQMAHSDFAYPSSSANVGAYSNEELDRVMEEAVAAESDEEAIELWRQAHSILAEDPNMAPVAHDRGPVIHTSEVEGFVVPGQVWYDFSVVSLSDAEDG